MHRTLYLIGTGYLAICAVIVLRHRTNTVPHVQTAQFDGPGSEWFVSMKPFCNAVEVELAHRRHPAPTTLEGRGFSAACFALGGKIDAARRVIDRLPPGERHRAAGIVFEVAHPVADAGDDRSAGPIMELVIEYWPNHYMALYHAGMSEFALGQPRAARTNLEAFLSYYHENDGWTQRARETLARLGAVQ